MVQSSSYVCDTIPAPRLATDHPPHASSALQVPNDPVDITSPSSVTQPALEDKPFTPRKLCVRHQRMADEGTNLKLQQVCIQSLALHIPNLIFPIVARCFARRRARSSQCRLVQLLIVLASSQGYYPPGSLDNVLLLSTLASHRATRTSHPHRSLHHSTP